MIRTGRQFQGPLGMDGKLQWRDLGIGKSGWSGGTGGQIMTNGGECHRAVVV